MCLTVGASDCSGHGLSHKEHAVMTLFAKTRIALISAAAGLGALTAAAIAQPSISLDVDTARVVKLGGEPATVVLSNPMFADATLQRDRLIILGKTTGRTQVIVLDLDGNQLANFMVSVQRTENQVVSMYKAGTRSTYHCEPFCDAVLNVGDDGVFFTGMEEQIRKKSVISSGAAQQGGGGAQ
jgi:Flp pilus assembly secretin CpaC